MFGALTFFVRPMPQARADVLHQSASQGHVEHLESAADGQNRHVRVVGRPGQRDFVGVALGDALHMVGGNELLSAHLVITRFTT